MVTYKYFNPIKPSTILTSVHEFRVTLNHTAHSSDKYTVELGSKGNTVTVTYADYLESPNAFFLRKNLYRWLFSRSYNREVDKLTYYMNKYVTLSSKDKTTRLSDRFCYFTTDTYHNIGIRLWLTP